MRREVFTHLAFWFSFFVFISLAKKWFTLAYWPFWVGGLVGTVLPDVDHIIYALYLKPQELASQRVNYMLKKREIWQTIVFLAETRYERTKLILHTATFQIVFLILTFLVVTSSGSLFGRGIVLAFGLHLLVDQAVDVTETGGLANWFRNFPFWAPKDKKQAWAWFYAGLFLLFLFGFLL